MVRAEALVWINPPETTVAVLLDVRNQSGAIRIHTGTILIDDVGPEEDRENRIIISWSTDCDIIWLVGLG